MESRDCNLKFCPIHCALGTEPQMPSFPSQVGSPAPRESTNTAASLKEIYIKTIIFNEYNHLINLIDLVKYLTV